MKDLNHHTKYFSLIAKTLCFTDCKNTVLHQSVRLFKISSSLEIRESIAREKYRMFGFF